MLPCRHSAAVVVDAGGREACSRAHNGAAAEGVCRGEARVPTERALQCSEAAAKPAQEKRHKAVKQCPVEAERQQHAGTLYQGMQPHHVGTSARATLLCAGVAPSWLKTWLKGAALGQ